MKRPFVILLLFLSVNCFSEITIDTTIAGNNLAGKEAWEKATKDLSYPDVKEQKKNKINPVKEIENTDSFKMPGWVKYLMFAIILAIFVLLIYRIVVILLRPADRKVMNNIEYEDLPDEFFPEEEYETFLKKSLADGNFKNAIRFSFLIVIRNLAEKKLIYKSREKTNFDYLGELATHPAFMPFRTMARAYEIVWYGDLIPDSENYKVFEHKFYELNRLISSTN